MSNRKFEKKVVPNTADIHGDKKQLTYLIFQYFINVDSQKIIISMIFQALTASVLCFAKYLDMILEFNINALLSQ